MKNKDVVSLSDQELVDKIKEAKEGLSKSTLNHAISPVEKPSAIRIDRRSIARLITEVNKRKHAAANLPAGKAGKTVKASAKK